MHRHSKMVAAESQHLRDYLHRLLREYRHQIRPLLPGSPSSLNFGCANRESKPALLGIHVDKKALPDAELAAIRELPVTKAAVSGIELLFQLEHYDVLVLFQGEEDVQVLYEYDETLELNYEDWDSD